MAKGNPNSATVQYKVNLKPSEIGLLVIKRLERPHVDVSPELRRLIELGYAAEQAGFSLDGTVLRHAGRSWDIQPDFRVEVETAASSADDKPAAGRQRAQMPRPAKSNSAGASSPATGEADAGPAAEKAGDKPTSTPGLRHNLRGLSG